MYTCGTYVYMWYMYAHVMHMYTCGKYVYMWPYVYMWSIRVHVVHVSENEALPENSHDHVL